MNANEIDRHLDIWFDVVEPRSAPADVLPGVFAVTRTTHQRHGLAGRFATLAAERRMPARVESSLSFRLLVVLLALLVTIISVAGAAGALLQMFPRSVEDGAIVVETVGPPRGLALLLPDGTVTAITPPDREEICAIFSPDGSRVAFFSAPLRTAADPEPAYELAIANATQGAARQLPVRAYRLPQEPSPPSWSPDGSAVVAVLLRPDQSMPISGDLMIVPINGSEPRPLLRSPLVREGEDTEPGLYRFQGVQWSPDGAWIAFRGELFDDQGWRYFVGVVRPDGSDLRLLDRWPLVGSLEWGGVVWSPDSTQVAYHRRPEGVASGGMDVHIASIDGAPVRPLEDVANAFVAEWSPDGGRIATVGLSVDSAHVFDVESGAAAALPVDGATYGATWSARGDRLAVLGDDSLWIVEPDGGETSEILAGVTSSLCAAVGPSLSWQEVGQ